MPLDAGLLDEARTAKAKVDTIDVQPDSDIARVEFIHAVQRLHFAGGSTREIIDALGVPHQLVQNIVASAGAHRSRAGAGQLLSCSFCGKHANQAAKLFDGRTKHICNECIDLVHTVLATDGNTADTPIATIRQLRAVDPAKRCSFCGKQRRHVAAMATTDHARICNECIALGDELSAEGLRYFLERDDPAPK